MDKLEQYLDQVCKSIGGPRSLRQHVRQELREHLLDAAAQYRAVGLSEEQALARALAEFGKPEEMRSELEATHGHRMMAVVIDKALEWKEKTMRAKWLWISWANLALAIVIALEVLFIACVDLFIVPKFKKLTQDGLIDPAVIDEQGVGWMVSWLNGFNHAAQYTTLWVIVAAVAWGLFEWRVKSENKSFMRLSALGTAAIALMAVVWLTASTLLISFCLGAPASGRLARAFALDQISKIDMSIDAIEQALPNQNWEAIEQHTNAASNALQRLTAEAAAIPALQSRNEPAAVDALRESVKGADKDLADAEAAVRGKDARQLEAALKKFRKTYEPVREAATPRQ